MVLCVKPFFIVLPAATLCVGIGIGWFARPMYGLPAEQMAVGAAASSSSGKPVAPAPATDRPTKTDRERPADETPKHELPDGAKDMVNKMQDATIARHRTSLEQHAAALMENLNLTPAQRESLETAITRQMAEMEKMMGRSGEPPNPDLFRMIGTGPLEESLASSLTPEQQGQLGDFKEREKARKIDARALKDLSRLQGIVDFKEGQRDEVYRILSVSAESSLDTVDPQASFAEMFSEGSGVEIDPYNLGLQKILGDSMIPDNGKQDPKESARKIREAVDLSIEDKVEKLRPVLDAAQLERYRAELKDKGLGVLSGMLMGME